MLRKFARDWSNCDSSSEFCGLKMKIGTDREHSRAVHLPRAAYTFVAVDAATKSIVRAAHLIENCELGVCNGVT